jgi:hypothetical protein
MPSTYTVNLGIEKPATGEQSGTWGDTVNDNSNILDEAINGVVSITLASAGSSGSPNSITITNGALSTGRNKWIEFTDGGDLGAAAYVQLTPNDAEKICFIRNSLTASRSIFLFQGTYNASNDLEIAAGTDVVVKFNGGGTGATVVNVYANLKVDGIVATTADINGGTVDGTVIGGAAAAALTATTVVANTSLNIAGTTTISSVLDEDNMASDSATALATQQSIKAYVDSQVGTVDTLSEILANGNTTGATDIDVDGAQKVQFRDAAIYINSSVDGQLDIVADTEIQIAATTIDINGAINASGEIIAASLDISGNVDIDGITNLDVVDIDGAVQIDAALTVGVDDTGYDVKFYGATGGAYMLWDESADDLILAGAAGLSVDGTTNLDVVDIDGAVDMASTLTVGSTISINEPAQTTYGLVSKVKSVYLSSTDATYANLTIRKEAATSTDYLQIRDSGNVLLANLTSLGGLITAPTAGGHAVFNEDGVDADFRVESDTNTHALFVQGSDGNVGIGTSSPGTTLDVIGPLRSNVSGGTPIVYLNNGTTQHSIQNTSDALTFFNNATERLRIDSSGNVGIGTSSPQSTYKLTISGTDSVFPSVYLENTTNSKAYSMRATGTSWIIRDNTVGADRLNIDSDGNVGIGTSSPAAKLHSEALGAGAVNAAMFSNSEGLANSEARIFLYSGGNTARGGYLGLINESASGQPASMTFATSAAYAAPTERMRIDSSGNVGIGAPPVAGLHIQTSTRSLSLAPSATGGGGGSYILMGNSDSGGVTGPNIITSGNRNLQFGVGDNFSSATGGTFSEYMRIDASGNLLVGTTSTIPYTFSSGTGAGITSTGTVMAGATAEAALFNRIGSDGSIVNFYKAGTIVGSIGNNGTNLTINGVGALELQENGTTRAYVESTGIHPWVNNTYDLGTSGANWKDLYLSGIAYATYVGSSGDTDTIIAFDTANTIRFTTGGSERLRIGSDGQLTSSVAGAVFNTRADGGGLEYTQLLDVATAGCTIFGKTNRGDVASISLYQTATGADGGYIRFNTANSGSTTPTEKARIDASGNLLVGGTAVGNGGTVAVTGAVSISNSTANDQASMSKEAMQQTSGVTTATTIFTSVIQGMSSAAAAQLIIYGNDNSANGFMDVVVTKGSVTPVVVSSTTVEGSPAARTYTMSGSALQLAMASGTYSVNVKCTTMGFPF